MPTMNTGGVEKNLINIANYLIKKYDDISIITLSKNYQKKFDKRIRFISLRLKLINYISKRKKFLLCLYLLFLQILKNKNVIVLCFQGNIYCTLLCKILGIKIIVRSNTSPDGWSKNLFKFFCYKYILSLANTVIVNSLEFKEKIKSKFNIDAVCIYNPLDVKEITRKSNIKQKIKFDKTKLNLINVARLVDQKDHMTLLKAVNRIKKLIDFNLLIIGEGEKKRELKYYINKNDLYKNVKLLGNKKNPFNLIKSSDIFILTSLYEGLPNVLLEAQALKTFIISTNCPTGPKEILLNGKAGSIFNVGDYKKLSKLILNFSKYQARYLKMKNIGYKNLFRFNYRANMEKYVKEIDLVLK